MGTCVWGTQIQESVAGRPCSPREGVQPHSPPPPGRRWVLGAAPLAPALGRALPAPFVASILRPRLSPGKRSAAGWRGGGQHCPASPFTSPSPPGTTGTSTPPLKRGPAVRGEGTPSGWTLALFWPQPQTGEVFPSPLTLFKFKATAAAPPSPTRRGSGPPRLSCGRGCPWHGSRGVSYTRGLVLCVCPRLHPGLRDWAPWGAPQVISSGWGKKFPRIFQGVRLELKAIVCPADGSHC